MPKKSAGLLLFREVSGQLEVLLAHPGGPFWAKKDEGAWSIPKGEFEDNEDPLEAAKREFEEETSFTVNGELIPLEPKLQPSGKMVYAWAIKMDLDPKGFKSNTFSMEWPPKSGRIQQIPEIDRIEWFAVTVAMRKILKGQADFIIQLEKKLGYSHHTSEQTQTSIKKSKDRGQQSLF